MLPTVTAHHLSSQHAAFLPCLQRVLVDDLKVTVADRNTTISRLDTTILRLEAIRAAQEQTLARQEHAATEQRLAAAEQQRAAAEQQAHLQAELHQREAELQAAVAKQAALRRQTSLISTHVLPQAVGGGIPLGSSKRPPTLMTGGSCSASEMGSDSDSLGGSPRRAPSVASATSLDKIHTRGSGYVAVSGRHRLHNAGCGLLGLSLWVLISGQRRHFASGLVRGAVSPVSSAELPVLAPCLGGCAPPGWQRSLYEACTFCPSVCQPQHFPPSSHPSMICCRWSPCKHCQQPGNGRLC